MADVLDVSQSFPYAPVQMDDYTLVNTSVSYEIQPEAEAYLRVENATDADYEALDGYGTAGRTFHVGLRATF